MSTIITRISFVPEVGVTPEYRMEKTIFLDLAAQTVNRNIDGFRIDIDDANKPSEIIVHNDISISNRIPMVSYKDPVSSIFKKQETTIRVEIAASYDFDDYKFFKHISNVAFENFRGLKDYIDSNIVINCSEQRNKLDIYFMPETEFIPLILFPPYKRTYPRSKYYDFIEGIYSNNHVEIPVNDHSDDLEHEE